MNPLFRSFGMFVQQIYKDSMLVMSCAATILAAFFFRLPQQDFFRFRLERNKRPRMREKFFGAGLLRGYRLYNARAK